MSGDWKDGEGRDVATERETHDMEKQFSEQGGKRHEGKERGLYFLDETCSVCEQGMNEDDGKENVQHMRHMSISPCVLSFPRQTGEAVLTD